jgi:hypothetical protein
MGSTRSEDRRQTSQAANASQPHPTRRLQLVEQGADRDRGSARPMVSLQTSYRFDDCHGAGAPKIATNKRSPRAPQPSAASAESVASSPTPGSIYRILFISHLFWKRRDPPGCEAQGGPGLAMTGLSAGHRATGHDQNNPS